MTASLWDSRAERLPVWRLIAGLAVLGILAALLVLAGAVYVDNFRLDHYMNSLAAQPDAGQLSDTVLANDILERAKQLGLSVHPYDIQIARPDGKPQIRIAKYSVQTRLVRMDLRLPAASSR